MNMSEIRDRIVKVLEESHISFMEEGIKDYILVTFSELLELIAENKKLSDDNNLFI